MVFEIIGAWLQAVWPRLGICLLLGFCSAVAVLMFDAAWWKRLIIAALVFFGWMGAGITLEIAHARKKRTHEPRHPAGR